MQEKAGNKRHLKIIIFAILKFLHLFPFQMASIFGDGGVDDLLNENISENDELPSGDEAATNHENPQEGENLFADGDDAAGGDGNEQAIKIEPKKRTMRNPRLKLTEGTLSGPRGIQTIEEYFTDIKFKGKGHEKHDLDEVMRRLQHWGHRMYPNYKFHDILANVERLGKKKPLQTHMNRYRLGMLENLKLTENQDIYDKEDVAQEGTDEPFDEFDALLGEQIAISKLAPRTPAGSSHRQPGTSGNSRTSIDVSLVSSTFATPSFARQNAVMSTPYNEMHDALNDTSDLALPLPPSQPSTPVSAAKKLTAEQLATIAENRRLAQERLRAKQMQREQEANV